MPAVPKTPAAATVVLYRLWRKLPPAQRRQLLEVARAQGPKAAAAARTHGPKVAAGVVAAARRRASR